jgi:hypothetical protein
VVLLFLVLSQEQRLMFTVLEMKIWIYWSESNCWIYFYIPVVLNKNKKIYWFEQSFTGLGPEDRTKFYWSWAGGPVLIVRTLFSETVAWISTSYATVRLVFIGGIVDHHCLSFHNYFEWELLSKTIDTGIFYSVIINIILY